MSSLILISDYGAFREISLSACYHPVSLSQTSSLFDNYMERLDLPPARAALYLSEREYEQLAESFAGCGVDFASTLAATRDGELADLYETMTPVTFEQLQAVLHSHARLIRSFERQSVLAA